MAKDNHAGHGSHWPRGPTGDDKLAMIGIAFMIIVILMLVFT